LTNQFAFEQGIYSMAEHLLSSTRPWVQRPATPIPPPGKKGSVHVDSHDGVVWRMVFQVEESVCAKPRMCATLGACGWRVSWALTTEVRTRGWWEVRLEVGQQHMRRPCPPKDLDQILSSSELVCASKRKSSKQIWILVRSLWRLNGNH
jgi:hypothetical protein